MLYSTVEGSGAARHQRLASRVRFGFAVMTFWRDLISRHVAQEQLFRKMSRSPMKSEVGLVTSPSCQHTLSAARFGPRCAAVVGDEVVDGTDPAGAAQVLGLL